MIVKSSEVVWVDSAGRGSLFAIAGVGEVASMVFTTEGDSDVAVREMADWLNQFGRHALVARRRLAQRLTEFGASASQDEYNGQSTEFARMARRMVRKALGRPLDLDGQEWRSLVTSWTIPDGEHVDVFVDGSRDHGRRFGAWAAVSPLGFPVYRFGPCASSSMVEFNALMLGARMLDRVRLIVRFLVGKTAGHLLRLQA